MLRLDGLAATFVIVSGPYGNHVDAIEAAQTRAHWLAQGWKP